MAPSFSEEDDGAAQFEAIFRAHVTDLYRYIYRQVHNAAIAEDLTSAVFLKALRRAALLEAEERSVQVESSALPYDERALRVLELAKEEARALNHNYVGTEHLLLGILREGSGAEELVTRGVTFEGMRGGIMFILGGRPLGIPALEPGFTPRTKQVLVLAGEEAQRVGGSTIGPRHLLVAILREGQGIAAQLLQVSGVRLEQVGEAVQISVTPDEEEGRLRCPRIFRRPYSSIRRRLAYLRSCLTPRKRGL